MSENTLLEARKAKFHYVREHVSPYPERYARTHELCEAAKLPDGVQDVCVAGRVTAIRRMGKLSFVTLSDMEGKLQIAVMRDEVGEDTYDFFKRGFDVGDFMGAEGEMFTTKVGEKTLRAKCITYSRHGALLAQAVPRFVHERGDAQAVPFQVAVCAGDSSVFGGQRLHRN